MQDPDRLQKAIAGAERERIFDMRAIEALPAPHPGSKRLQAALADYRAELAWTRPGIEDLAVLALGRVGLIPQVNVLVDGVEVDLWFPEANLAIELDSYKFHSPAAISSAIGERTTRWSTGASCGSRSPTSRCAPQISSPR